VTPQNDLLVAYVHAGELDPYTLEAILAYAFSRDSRDH
jgi:hypothetical protein